MSKRRTWKDKVNPINTHGHKRAKDMSDQLTSILLCLVPQQGSTSNIAELAKTSDNYLVARMQGDISFNAFVGSFEETKEHLVAWFTAVQLTQHETRSAWQAITRQLTSKGYPRG
jgi:hypothetical protein